MHATKSPPNAYQTHWTSAVYKKNDALPSSSAKIYLSTQLFSFRVAMAYTINFSLLALLVLLAISGRALAGRQIPDTSKDVDVKQPQFLLKSDRSFLIPGIGRVLVPAHPFLKKPHPHLDIPSYGPHTGTNGGYLPGGDDTFVSNPGYEAPNPGRAGSVAPPAHP